MTDIEKDNYRRAKGYLYKAARLDNYQDVLHDAYVNYHKRSGGQNLFKQSQQLVIKVIKNQFWEFCRLSMYKKDGIRYPKEFLEFEDHTYNNITPHDEYVVNETYNSITGRLNSFYKPVRIVAQQVLDLKLQGYSQNEIVESLGIPQQRVSYYLMVLKKDHLPKRKLIDTSNKRIKINESA
jgi:hypothetical protein